MANLNENQAKAIKTITSPLLVVAGAGTGKTTMITEKIKFISDYLDVAPDRILAITFTNKAAKEMKKRVEKENSKYPYILTFHSFGLKILKNHYEEAGLNKDFSIYDEKDQLSLIKEIIKEKNIDKDPRKILNQISLIKEMKYLKPNQEIDDIFKTYQEQLLMNNAVDFDDIITLSNQIFKNYPEIKDFWKNSFDYILIDEFQDTNIPQLEIIKHLYNEQYKNLTAVGDPNQCIYSWRGSEIENILNFKNHFKDAQVIKLEKNYRSTKSIIFVANKLVENKIPEELLPLLNTENKKGIPPIIKIFKSDTEEAKKISSAILHLYKEKKYMFKDFAILVRNTNMIPEIEKQFLNNKIPYKIHGKYTFIEKSEIKLILNYIKLAINPKDEIALKYCLNKPSRNIGNKTFEMLKNSYKNNWIETLKSNIEKLNKKQKEEIIKFLEKLEKIKSKVKNNEKKDLIKEIVNIYDLKSFFEKKYKDKKLINKKLKNINMLDSLINESQSSIKDFIQNLHLQSAQDEIKDNDEVKIITIHSAKGLEFPVVFIPGIEEEIISSKEEEERRVLYTAITRAKEILFMSAVKYRKGYDGIVKKAQYSNYLREIVYSIKQKLKV